MSEINRQLEIHTQAWRIFKMVRSKQDVLAERELQALDDGTLPVAHSLVLGEFRSTPIAKFEWYFIGTVFVAAPVICTLFINVVFGTPRYINDPAQALLFYFGVFAAAFLVESGLAALVMEMRDRRLRKLSAANPVHRTNEIASSALATAEGNHADLIGAILDAGAVEPEPTPMTRRKLDEALIRLLPYCMSETLLQLNSRQRRGLWSRLGGVIGIVRPFGIGPGDERKLSAADEYHEAMIGIAILRTYERLPDERAIGTVRSLTTKSPVGRGAGWPALIEAAKHCLPILEEIVRQSRDGSELLRGSSDSNINGAELLRSLQSTRESDSRELLRAGSD